MVWKVDWSCATPNEVYVLQQQTVTTANQTKSAVNASEKADAAAEINATNATEIVENNDNATAATE